MKNWLLPPLPLMALRKKISLSAKINRIVLDAAAGLSARLSSRERRFVILAGIALVGVILFLFVISPLWDFRERLQARVVTKERELIDVATLADTYEQLRHELERGGAASAAALSPFAFLEGLTTSTLGREKLAAINPLGREERGGVTQETVELRLSGVSLQELVDLLYKIDAAGAT